MYNSCPLERKIRMGAIIRSKTMRQLFLIYFACFVTSLVEAQENDRKNSTSLENKTTLEYKINLENRTTLEYEINLENRTTLEYEINLENKTISNKNLSLDGRIVNGTEAYLGQFPQQVSLRRAGSKNHFCGGSIIHVQWILTAAHCMFIGNGMEFEIPPSSIIVVAGDVLLQGASCTQQERKVTKMIIHQKFNKYTLENDITLLQLAQPFIQNGAIHVAKMPTGPAKPGTFCDVFGWGYPSEDEKITSNILMYVTLPLISQETCRKFLNEVSNVPDGMLCAGYIEGGKDACQGDSGGGMLCKNMLTGVVSGGKGCANPKLPGLYSDVYFYRHWIKSSMLNANLPKVLRQNKNSASVQFVNMFWLMSSLFSVFLLSMYC